MSEPPLEADDREEPLLLVQFGRVDAAIPRVAGDVLPVRDVLRAGEDGQRPTPQEKAAIDPQVQPEVIGQTCRVYLRDVVDAAPLGGGLLCIERRRGPAGQI